MHMIGYRVALPLSNIPFAIAASDNLCIKDLCEDFHVAEVDEMKKTLRPGKDHGDTGGYLSVYPHTVRGTFFDRHCLLDHPYKANSLKECCDKV